MIRNLQYFLLLTVLPVLSGCSIVSGIFKAGMWWAFFLVFIVIAAVLWMIFRSKK